MTRHSKIELAQPNALQAWEEFIEEQVYPEPGTKAKEDYRNYDNPGRETVREFYRQNHLAQTFDFVSQKRDQYLKLNHRRMSIFEALDFLNTLARRTGCGVLCDVNNVYVTCGNLGGDPAAWLDVLDARTVGEIHLAGHAVNDADGQTILIDDHGSPVSDPVWALYERALRRFGPTPTLIEWDTNVPPLEVLLGEAARAQKRLASVSNVVAA